MAKEAFRFSPGRVRDAVQQVLSHSPRSLSVKEIGDRVSQVLGPTPTSSVRSYLRLNTPNVFVREKRGLYSVKRRTIGEIQRTLAALQKWHEPVRFDKASLFHADCFDWIEQQPDHSIHAVVTDPPYGLHEYSPEQQAKLRIRKGGV